MKCPLHLQVPESTSIWQTLSNQYHESKNADRLPEFKHSCMITAASKECYLLNFLIENERTFDDDELVQAKFKTLADDHIIYDYFSKVIM